MSFLNNSCVSVKEMAQIVGLSRSRFNQLIGTAFPKPKYIGKRPYYDQEDQEICLTIKERRIGINGEPIMFQQRNNNSAEQPKQRTVIGKKPKQMKFESFFKKVKAFGSPGISEETIKQIIGELCPSGRIDFDDDQLFRSVLGRLAEKSMGKTV